MTPRTQLGAATRPVRPAGRGAILHEETSSVPAAVCPPPAPGCRTGPGLCRAPGAGEVLPGQHPARPVDGGLSRGALSSVGAAGWEHPRGIGRSQASVRCLAAAGLSQAAQSRAGSSGCCPPPALRWKAFHATPAELSGCDAACRAWEPEPVAVRPSVETFAAPGP